jgi:RNA-directed DNA polymerase
MSWWKKVVEFFAGPPTPEAPPEPSGSPLEVAVWKVMRAFVAAKQPFSTAQIAHATAKELGTSDGATLIAASKASSDLFERGLLEPYGWTRTGGVFHAKGTAPTVPGPAPSKPPPKPVPTAGKQPSPQPTSKAAPAPSTSKPLDPYDVGAILSLTKDELRARALKIVPWKTAWIGRVDVIPPEADERTALIDRGLELRGFLSRIQLTEIHRIGDLWLKHKDGARLAETIAKKNVEEAIAQTRIQKQLAKEAKKKAALERKAKHAADVALRKETDIVYLGRGVSFGLVDRRSHVERLNELGLPLLSTPADVATALGVTIPQLRFLAFHAEASRVMHYRHFEVPKRTGGVRRLSAPMPKLATAQAWILANVLEKLPTESPAHGFIKGRSTVTNARPHAGRDIVVNQDLVDFFPTITFPRVRGMFARCGYSPAVATILALLTTECPRQEATYAGTTYHVAIGPRVLPQGACTSPAISNQITKKLDRRLLGLSNKRGFRYTRYADDLSFSAGPDQRETLGRFLASVRHVVEEEGFEVHVAKGRVQRAARRQTVTGIVVNEAHKLGVPREEVRRVRAILHNAKKTGLAAQNRDGHPSFEAWLRGKIAYIAMVDRARGMALLRELDALPR